MKEDLLSISAIQNTQIIMLCENSVGTTSACDPASIIRLPTVWDAPSSVI